MEDRWNDTGENDDDDHFATTAAITDRLDPFSPRNCPPGPKGDYGPPGKSLFDNDDVLPAVWD